MGRIVGVLIAIVAVGFLVRDVIDDADPPSNKCNASQLGCADLKAAKKQGIISGFEEYDAEPGSVITWEIDDQDKEFLLVFEGKNNYYVQYDELEAEGEQKARRLRDFLDNRRGGALPPIDLGNFPGQ